MRIAIGLMTLALVLSAGLVAPAQAVESPSPLNCHIHDGICTDLSGVGQLTFSSPSAGTLIVTYDAPDGFKIVGGDQFGLNFSSDITGTLNVSLTINAGTPATTTELITPQQVDGCSGCFNFLLGPSFIAPSAPTGSVYVFTITGDPDLSLASVIAGGPLGLDAELHLNTGGPNGASVFAAERPQGVPEPGTLTLLGTAFISGSLWARRQLSSRKN